LRTMGYKILSDINAVSVVMPTALIGTVLLTLRGRGVGKAEMIRRVEWLSNRVRAKGGRVAHFAGAPTSVVVDRGLEVLGKDLVGLIEGLAEPTYYAVDRFQLSFYRNMTIHLFISGKHELEINKYGQLLMTASLNRGTCKRQHVFACKTRWRKGQPVHFI
jgi:glycerol-3-phosphate O-acyltransferase